MPDEVSHSEQKKPPHWKSFVMLPTLALTSLTTTVGVLPETDGTSVSPIQIHGCRRCRSRRIR